MQTFRNQCFHNKLLHNRQSGAVLAITLIIMLVLTLLVVSTAQTVTTQEKMTAAVRDIHVSLAAAESATVEAEKFIELQTTTTVFNNSAGLYEAGDGPHNLHVPDTWDAAKTVLAAKTIEGVESRYFIEDVGIVAEPGEDLSGVNLEGYDGATGGGEVNVFRIVSRATGRSGNAERVVLSYYGKRF